MQFKLHNLDSVGENGRRTVPDSCEMEDDEGFLISFYIRFGLDAQVCLLMSLLLQRPSTFKTLGENHGNQRVLGKRTSEFLKKIIHGRKRGTAIRQLNMYCF